MSRKDNRSKNDKKVVSINKGKTRHEGPTRYGLAKYLIQESKVLQFPYGKVNFHEGDVLICPHNIPVQKKPLAPLEDVFKPFGPDVNLNGKNLLIERYGGAGDILCLMPAIYEIKKKYPHSNIGLMCSYSYLQIAHNFPELLHGGVNNVVLYDAIKHVDYFVSLEGYLENHPDKDKNIHDIYAEGLFQTLDEHSVPGAMAHNRLISQTSIGRQGIGIQYSTNAPIRDFDLDKLIEVINLINRKYPNELVHLLGPADDYLVANYVQAKTNGQVLVNGCGRQPMSFLETFDLVNSLKMVIAPDSSMIHFAGFNNTPIIGLYGPFSSKSRLSRYFNATGIDGKADCSPCNRHHPLQWCKWTGGQGLCLNTITPEIIMNEVEKMMVLYS